ncbi:MAG TPA: alpha/beta fold hydrolase [Gemmataceae bacterium]|nr:alpha/beta fold hydrolase [Gemmataceae bacterium]
MRTPAAEFCPLPLLSNGHLQTLLGTLFTGPALADPAEECRVRLPDGDQIVFHQNTAPSWQPGDRIALLVHGLGGSHRSRHIQRMARLLLTRGWRVIRMDLRGCGNGLPLARYCYHGGCSDDVRAVAAEIARMYPTSPLTAIGVSLGGNIVLKMAGEVHEHPLPNLERVTALAPPIDLTSCAAMLARPQCRLYERHFLKDLIAEAVARQQVFPDLPPLRFPRTMTIRLFDELYTAPRRGFADASDYYRRSSSMPLLERIQVPTLILAARDDPFIAVEPFEALSLPASVRVRIQNHGGHLGFLGRDGAGGYRWAEQRIVDWITE